MKSLKDLFRTAIAVVIVLAIASVLTHNTSTAAPAKSTAPARGYYLTPGNYNGDQALTACVPGYHMASFGEISDPSNLRYDTTLGRGADDAGSGPPSFLKGVGWVRSGYSANTNFGTQPLPTNCNLWKSASGSDYGEVAYPWPNRADSMFFDALKCDNSEGGNVGVWCVQD